jgi:hypothetical protein
MSDTTSPDPVMSTPTEPAHWPKVVGIISICWAGLGMFCGACGLASMLMMSTLTASAEKQLGPMPDVMKPNMPQTVMVVVSFIPTVLLLVAGIATLRRKPAGRGLHLVYAIIGLVIAVIATIINFKHQADVMAWAKANPSDKWAPQAGSPLSLIPIVLGLLLSIAWPLFCMIWFGAIKRDAKDLDGGTIEPGI